ncbi:hypothetical protein ACFL6T_04390 [Candidatus Zixiibacteriota bacterium]
MKKGHGPMRRIVACLSLFSFLTACSPPPVLSEPELTLVQVYCDLALLAGDAGDVATDSLRNSVFERYGYSQDSYEQALQVYQDDTRRWILFFQAVSDTIERRTEVRPEPLSR